MWLVRSTNSALIGRKTRRLTISSQLLQAAVIDSSLHLCLYRHALREYNIHKTLHHPNIVTLYDVFEIDTNS